MKRYSAISALCLFAMVSLGLQCAASAENTATVNTESLTLAPKAHGETLSSTRFVTVKQLLQEDAEGIAFLNLEASENEQNQSNKRAYRPYHIQGRYFSRF